MEEKIGTAFTGYYARYFILNLYMKVNGLGPAKSLLILIFLYLKKTPSPTKQQNKLLQV